jgi:hypothetical protein
VVGLIDVNNIPRSGTLIVSVYFDGYKQNYQNDTRRLLKDGLNKICADSKLSTEIMPITFSLIKTVSGKITRATGAQYQYGYSNMTTNDIKIIYKKLKERKLSWWKEIQFLIADDIEGLE